MAGISIEFEFTDEADEDQFVREYLAPSWDEFERRDDFDFGWFWRSGHLADYDLDGHPDGRWVSLVLEGNPDEFLAREREVWEELRADGRLDSWTTRRFAEDGYDSLLEHQRDVKGEVGGEMYVSLKVAVTRMTVRLLAEFDDQLPVVGETTDANPGPVNFWTIIHLAMLQNGYDWYDEMDACSKAIRNRSLSLAEQTSRSHASDALRERLDELEAFADRLDPDEEV